MNHPNPIYMFQNPPNPQAVIIFFHDILWGEKVDLHMSPWMSSSDPPFAGLKLGSRVIVQKPKSYLLVMILAFGRVKPQVTWICIYLERIYDRTSLQLTLQRIVLFFWLDMAWEDWLSRRLSKKCKRSEMPWPGERDFRMTQICASWTAS